MNDGRTLVVLSKYVEHSQRLYQRLINYADKVFLLSGSNSKKEHQEILKHMNQVAPEESMILVATGKLIGVFNYPYNALEEALVNAVLHKNYKEDVPVEIRIYLDQIQIINFPGQDHYIDMENFAAGKVRARRYRNPKIGGFFKEIDLSEKKSTGISKILH